MIPRYKTLWYWVGERERIRIRRAAGWRREEWTKDEILAEYKFCNVRREDDRVTIWIREHIREPFANRRFLWLMLCIARQINWPPTLQFLMDAGAWPDHASFHPSDITEALERYSKQADKVYTGAYMISAPKQKGASKHKYIAEDVIGGLWRRREDFDYWQREPMERVHKRIMKTPGWGQFMAYQAVVDMRFTKLLMHAPDVNDWAAAGPGTLRGLNRVHGRATNTALNQPQALEEMQAIYEISFDKTGVPMDFSDVPNILCETDKYLRLRDEDGQVRAKFKPFRVRSTK